MMLRLAKPKNFVASSPSVIQRSRMKAPEWLPLIMEPESRSYPPNPIKAYYSSFHLDFNFLHLSFQILHGSSTGFRFPITLPVDDNSLQLLLLDLSR